MNESKRRVALVLESLGRGGTEAYVAQLSDYLQSNSYSVAVIVLSGEVGEDNSWNCPIRTVNWFRLPFFLRRHAFAICHFHLYANLFPATIGVKIAGIPVLSTIHMPVRAWGFRHRCYTLSAIALADRVVGVSRDALGGANRTNIHPHPIPAPIAKEFLSVQRVSEPGSALKVLSVGRLAREKNLEVILRAMASASHRLPVRPVLTHFGEGPLRQRLAELAQELDVSVQWQGVRSRSEIAQALSTADLFVLPSKFEGSPLAAMEAMAIGAPTLLASFPSARELVENHWSGHIFPVGDADALADLLVWHSEHPEQSAVMGMRGRAFALSHFSEARCFGHYLSLYDELAHDG